MRILFAFLRLGAALAYLVAIGTQLYRSVGLWVTQEGADIPFLILGFFSYFTMETGLVAAVVLVLGARTLLRGRRASPALSAARGLMVVYAGTTSIAYNLLLRPIEVPDGSSEPWANEWLHVVGPVFLLVDLLLAPDRRPLRWSLLWLAAAFPVLWAVYTFLRGPFALDTRFDAPWYPYPFLNPHTGGYPSAMLYVAILTALILALAALVVLLSRVGPGRADAGTPAADTRASPRPRSVSGSTASTSGRLPSPDPPR